jgi:hypothetical protein
MERSCAEWRVFFSKKIYIIEYNLKINVLKSMYACSRYILTVMRGPVRGWRGFMEIST